MRHGLNLFICLLVMLVASCTAAPQQQVVLVTPAFSHTSAPTIPASPTSAPTATAIPTDTPLPPTPTALPAAPTSPPPTAVPATKTSPKRADSMKIRLKLEATVITATLIDSKTTRDFISLLPLTLTLEDYAGTEKISDLPKRLSTEGAPSGSDPSVGDIAFYVPWGNLAIFYRNAGYASGLVILGKMDSGIEALNVHSSVEVTIEPVSEP